MKVRVPLIVLCVIVALVVVTQILVHRSAVGHARSHAIMRTKLELDSISSAARSMASFSPALNARLRATNLDARLLYQVLSSSNSGVRFLDSNVRWERAGELLDDWGHPLRVAVAFPSDNTNRLARGGAARFRIWSVGPDGKNECGNGDDITTEFDIESDDRVTGK